MLLGERRALRRDDVLHAVRETRDEVELAFADDGVAGVENRALGFVEAEENFALGENRRLWRVDVFRHFFVARQNASAETHDAALLIANREHQPPSETVVMTAGFFLFDDEAGLLDSFERKTFALRPVHRVVPQFRRGTDAELFDRVRRDAALGEIIAGKLAGGFVGETVLPARRELFVNVEQLILEMPRFLRAGRVLKFQRNFRALREPAHGVHEADVLVFLDEGEHVAALVAAEAMEDLLVRIDVEARRLFLMKRAERGEVRAGFFQRQIRADDVHDVAGGADLLAGRGGKESGHAKRGISGRFPPRRAWSPRYRAERCSPAARSDCRE